MSERARTDELRSLRLLLGEQLPTAQERLAQGRSAAEQQTAAALPDLLKLPAVRRALRSRPVPPRPVRIAQQVQRRRHRLDYQRAVADPLERARRELLGEQAAQPPRFLVRVDEFPHYQAWDDPDRYGTAAYLRFHEIMRGAGVPYLIAVLPRVSHASLDPTQSSWRTLEDDERELLGRLPAEGVSFALHGRDHRTRHASPRRHSELCGLSPQATETLLEEALAELAPLGIAPEIFVPPFNRFDASQYDALARRFRVVCGGPESVALLGFQRTPLWRGEAVYLPSYFPLYGRASDVLPEAQRLIDRQTGVWAPIVLHWGWEADADWGALERLVERIASYTAHWDDFLLAVRDSEQV